MSATQHDLILLGGGPAGYVAALRAAQLGMNVACVEEAASLGGTCLRVGCLPSKALLESSEHFAQAAEGLTEHGVHVAGVELDLATMMKRKEKIVTILGRGIESLFKKNGITRYQGHGRLAGSGKVQVANDGDTVELEAPRIILATGSRPAGLPGVEFDYDLLGTSTEALSYPEVPAHLVVIGAGAIGLELGSVWRRLGAEVTVLEYLDRILPGMDGGLAAEAQRALQRQGLAFELGCRVTSAQVEDGVCVVEREGGEPLEADRVLVAVGRAPNTEGLGLETVGLETTDRGFVPVDKHYATAAEGVYAIGDVIGGPMLAHKAEEEGIACVEWLATGYGHVNYDALPAVVYTDPGVAGVGKTEEQLQAAGVSYRKGEFPFVANGRARAMSATTGKVKLLADAETDRLLGVHVLGPRAEDLIAEATLALELGASSEDLARTSHAHPTLSEALKEAALVLDERGLHV